MNFSPINKQNKTQNQQVSFTGQKTVKDAHGSTMWRVIPPNIELNEGEKLGIEYLRLKKPLKSGDYEWKPLNGVPRRFRVDEEFSSGKKNYIDINLKDYMLNGMGEFGYRFVVYNKNGEPKKYYTDSVGSVTKVNDSDQYTIASTKMGYQNKGGSMMHIFTDSYGVAKNSKHSDSLKSYLDELKILKHTRNHFNNAGGNINGITEKIDNELESYNLIMSTPLIGGGKISSHKYHPSNHFQISEGVGTKEDFMKLQEKCFDTGKAYVLDGAFTSQGYEGIQFNHALRWANSPFKDWFKNSGEKFNLAFLPDTDNAHTGIRIVNPMGVEGYEYDPKRPTYIQFYDDRLVSGEQLDHPGELIYGYAKLNTNDPYEIVTHQDAVAPNYIEVDPNSKLYRGRTKALLKDLENDGVLGKILAPEEAPYKITKKGSQGGFTGWDGNVDLVKMNLSNHIPNESKIEGSKQAGNYMSNVLTYWTNETNLHLIKHIADELKNIKETSPNPERDINNYFAKLEGLYNLPKGRLNEVYGNIKSQDASKEYTEEEKNGYNCRIGNHDPKDSVNFILKQVLDFPLESLELSPELLGILSTPYLTPRPSFETEANSDTLKILDNARANSNAKFSPTMDGVLTSLIPNKIIAPMLHEIQDVISSKMGDEAANEKALFRTNGNNIELTPYGKYFLSMAMNRIMTYVLEESLFPNESDLSSEEKIKKHSFYALDIYASNPQMEAEAVAKKIKKGVERLINERPQSRLKSLKNELVDKYMQCDVSDYRMAEAIVDQTGAGLNWRFDAAKDVADWDEVRSGKISSETAWQNVIDFWKSPVQKVRQINPGSYMIAEVTSLHDFNKYDWGIFGNADKAENAFYEETGATTGSNYSVYFGAYTKLFGRNVEEGNVENYASIATFLNNTQNFIKSFGKGGVPAEFTQYSHVFLDNHDKPRAAHLMAVDPQLFWRNFKVNGKLNRECMDKAEKYLNRPFDDDMSSKAVAVAEKYYQYIDEATKELGLGNEAREILKKATSHLANGYKYMANPKTEGNLVPDFTKADAFGSMPFENTIFHVIKQAEAMGLDLSYTVQEELYNNIRARMIAPYQSKIIPIAEMMFGTTGVPTLFAGDELSQTGSETSSKNSNLGCRNLVRHDWLQDRNSKKDVINTRDRISAIFKLSKQPGASALKDGFPIVIPAVENKIIIDDFESVKSEETIQNALYQINNANDEDIYRSIGGKNSEFAKKVVDFAEDNDLSGAPFIEQLIEYISASNENLKELISVLDKCVAKSSDTGFKDYIMGKFGCEQLNEVGAMYKYNDKGDGVLTVITNAFINKDPYSEQQTLMTTEKDGVKGQLVSDIPIKDVNGNLIERPGTRFIRKKYDEAKAEYVDDGVFTYTKEGKLVSSSGEEARLEGTATYFVKDPSSKKAMLLGSCYFPS